MPLLSETENTSSVSHFSKIVANEVTKIINLPVLSDNVRNGVAGCLYNVTIPNIDNWRRFGLPPDYRRFQHSGNLLRPAHRAKSRASI